MCVCFWRSMRRTSIICVFGFTSKSLFLRNITPPLINDTCTQIISPSISCTDNYPMLWHNNTGFCFIQSLLSTCTSALFWTSDSNLKNNRSHPVFAAETLYKYLVRITLCFRYSGRNAELSDSLYRVRVCICARRNCLSVRADVWKRTLKLQQRLEHRTSNFKGTV